ncbi:hypothetical protein [Kiloniella sp. b19]|uniref:hypothetical protein n=1 Tax=Kiloniella sp. GXU_MW_B19 TaxID=3141326 RepID=UPI0031E3A1A6
MMFQKLVPVTGVLLMLAACAQGGQEALATADSLPPALSEAGQQGYLKWLSAEGDKAFAYSGDGSWAAVSGQESRSKAREKALQLCERNSKDEEGCVLFAVNGVLQR